MKAVSKRTHFRLRTSYTLAGSRMTRIMLIRYDFSRKERKGAKHHRR
jgi:hypothetical protein